MTLRPQVEDWTPPRRSRLGRIVVVAMALIALGVAVDVRRNLGDVDQEVHQLEREAASYRRDVAGAMLEVAGGHQQQAEQLDALARRLQLVCDTLEVLVGVTPGRARLPRTIGDACQLPPATSAMLEGGGR